MPWSTAKTSYFYKNSNTRNQRRIIISWKDESHCSHSGSRSRSSRSVQSSTSQCGVGFVGFGNMGLPMAINLQNKSNISVYGYDIDSSKRNDAHNAGIDVVDFIHHMIIQLQQQRKIEQQSKEEQQAPYNSNKIIPNHTSITSEHEHSIGKSEENKMTSQI